MIKIGHRGAAGYEPENTLRSFRKALQLKVDMIELDVYVCKTGELVVIHDDQVDRTTNGKGYVKDKTFKELRTLDAGKREKIPTLEEVFDLVNKKIKINIELKGPNTAKPVSNLIEKYVKEKRWAYNSFLVSSFNLKELEKFSHLSPKVKIGILKINPPIYLTSLIKKFHPNSININVKFTNKSFVEKVHKLGIKVYTYTANTKEEIKKMKKIGVDGIFSNFPDRL